MADVDSSKKVYLFLHGRMDLHEKMLDSLANNGFQKENAIMGNPKQAGEVGDYMVNYGHQDQIQKISKFRKSQQ